MFQGLQGALGLALGEVADRRVHRDHAQDHQRVDEPPCQKRHAGGSAEQSDRQRIELVEKNFPVGAGHRLWQHIGAVPTESFLGGCLGQALRPGGLQSGKDSSPLAQVPRLSVVPVRTRRHRHGKPLPVGRCSLLGRPPRGGWPVATCRGVKSCDATAAVLARAITTVELGEHGGDQRGDGCSRIRRAEGD